MCVACKITDAFAWVEDVKMCEIAKDEDRTLIHVVIIHTYPEGISIGEHVREFIRGTEPPEDVFLKIECQRMVDGEEPVTTDLVFL
jgi:hypothetical protein